MTANIFDENRLDAKSQYDIAKAAEIFARKLFPLLPAYDDPNYWDCLDDYAIQIANACRRKRIELQIGAKP